MFVDIGSGWGNVLNDILLNTNLNHKKIWGVEMNTIWKKGNNDSNTENINENKNQSSCNNKNYNDKFHIEWCKLEDIEKNEYILNTSVAFMYDHCLKRLSRKAQNLQDDPHYHIQCVLLDSIKMPSLKYFISTYEPDKMKLQQHGHEFKLIEKKRLACSTNAYDFYIYERIKQ